MQCLIYLILIIVLGFKKYMIKKYILIKRKISRKINLFFPPEIAIPVLVLLDFFL